MDIYAQIKQRMRSMSTPVIGGLELYLAEVVSVESDTTCTLKLEDDLNVSDVRLRSVVNEEESGILVTPKVGSIVLAADLSGGMKTVMTVLMYSEIEKIEINGGKNDGLININDLVDRLNKIEDDINKLKTAMGGWTPVSKDGGAALKTAITDWANQQLTKTKKSDMEDDKITH